MLNEILKPITALEFTTSTLIAKAHAIRRLNISVKVYNSELRSVQVYNISEIKAFNTMCYIYSLWSIWNML